MRCSVTFNKRVLRGHYGSCVFDDSRTNWASSEVWEEIKKATNFQEGMEAWMCDACVYQLVHDDKTTGTFKGTLQGYSKEEFLLFYAESAKQCVEKRLKKKEAAGGEESIATPQTTLAAAAAPTITAAVAITPLEAITTTFTAANATA
jgi:putative N-acetylmannosamine-6-phosphate epimerase